MNAHQLCAINKLPPSLIRGYLLRLASGVHERKCAPEPDMARPLDQITPSVDGFHTACEETQVHHACAMEVANAN